MKTLYIDCPCGICGDMLLSAFIDLGISAKAINDEIAKLRLKERPVVKASKKTKSGFSGTLASVFYDRSRNHNRRSYSDIIMLIKRSALNHRIKAKALEMFRIIGEAESRVHGIALSKIHFHEIGATDSIADIVGVAAAFEMLGPPKVYFSAPPKGSGTIRSQHGPLPLPAPAASLILEGIPVYGANTDEELVTPTGAAIVKALADGFVEFPSMSISRQGVGLAKGQYKNLPAMLRIFEGREEKRLDTDRIFVVEANIDDFSGEHFGNLQDLLFKAGSLDVTITPTLMKKGRPGYILSVLCRRREFESVVDTIFGESSTIGLRYHEVMRRKLKREELKVKTPWGALAAKKVSFGDKTRFYPEYEDLRAMSLKENIPLAELEPKVLTLLNKNKGKK